MKTLTFISAILLSALLTTGLIWTAIKIVF
jgi:hypothetical protein